MACDCNPAGYYAGLGQIDIGALGSIFDAAKSMWDNLLASLGIGAGRREADVIVPVQNRIVSDVIAPIFAYLDGALNKGQTTDCTTVKNYVGELSAAKQNWLFFLHNTNWQDGRAAQQAEATLAPYFTQAETGLQTLTAKYCGSTGVIGAVGDTIGNTINSVLTTSSGGFNWPVVLLGVGAVYFLMKRK